MHSRIFQISTEPIDKENYLNEDTLQQGDGSFYDYCSEIDEENRKEDIANLVNYALPNGMFELISDDTMRYNGGIEQWKEEYVANIKKRADALTASSASILSVSSLRALITIIGIFDQVRIFLITSTPSMSGSPKSSRTISGLCDDASKMALEAFGAVTNL